MKVLALDQSTSALGMVVTVGGQMTFHETLCPKTDNYLERILWLRDAVRVKVDDLAPDIVVMEDYAYAAHSSADAILKELGGVLKLQFFEIGYRFDRDTQLTGHRIGLVQSSASMKKFTLGEGNVKKDTSYLMKIYERTKIRFADDNIADAYMHAHMAGIRINAMRGVIDVGMLFDYQQEALMSAGVARRKKLNMKQALKLTSAEKRELVGW